MSNLEDRVREFVSDFITKTALKKNLSISLEAGDKESLIKKGVLDSLDFLELLTSIQQEFQCELDISEEDPAEFTSYEGIVSHTLKSLQNNSH